MTGIAELRQISENEWKAKYQGNYGVYTLKIITKEDKTAGFSCSCPSDYYPCKHISMIEDAIAEQKAINKKLEKDDGIKVEDLIKNVPAEKQRDFIAARAKYDNDFFNAVLLEFVSNAGSTKGNKYSKIIQKALASIDLYQFGYDDYYDSEGDQDIDILDQWFDKAQNCVRLKQYDEAIQICKACIEEYSQWLHNIGEDASLQFSPEYQSIPFGIIEEAAEHAGKKELFNYCLLEMKKKKYAGTDFDSCFQHLLGSLALTVDPEPPTLEEVKNIPI
jgi:hypothetical protein